MTIQNPGGRTFGFALVYEMEVAMTTQIPVAAPPPRRWETLLMLQ